eukprot:13060550-Alexandrium_andersonii.AAC.1
MPDCFLFCTCATPVGVLACATSVGAPAPVRLRSGRTLLCDSGRGARARATTVGALRLCDFGR